jgi:hypothetical protein
MECRSGGELDELKAPCPLKGELRTDQYLKVVIAFNFNEESCDYIYFPAQGFQDVIVVSHLQCGIIKELLWNYSNRMLIKYFNGSPNKLYCRLQKLITNLWKKQKYPSNL